MEKTYSWVNASSRNTTGHRDGIVKTNANSHGIERHLNGSVVLDNHKDEGAEEEGADGFGEEHLHEQVSVIVAAVARAELENVISVLGDLLGVALFLEDEAASADGNSKHGANTLGDYYQEGEGEVPHPVLLALLEEDGEGNSGIKMAAADLTKYLNQDEYGAGNTSRGFVRGATPVGGNQYEGRTNDLGDEHERFVVKSTWNFHLFLINKYI